MRVLGTEAVQDPTKVEAHVRAQMAKRQKLVTVHLFLLYAAKIQSSLRIFDQMYYLILYTVCVCITVIKIQSLKTITCFISNQNVS